MKIEDSSILGQNFRKILTILIGLVLIVSGLIITTVPVGAGAKEPRGQRQDPDNETNDFSPTVTVNTPANPVGELGYLNVGWLIINVTVTDDDESGFNATSGIMYWNGTNISAVNIDLTTFGGANDTAMTYMPDQSFHDGHDNESGQGIYHYNLSIDGFPAGDYLIKFNATDNWGMLDFNASLTLKLSQVNRGPSQRAGAITTYVGLEDQWTIQAPLIINLNDTVFYDDDVANGPFPNTVEDSLTITFWDDFTNAWMDTESNTPVVGYYENLTVLSGGSGIPDYTIYVLGWENKSTTGPIDVMVNATDLDGEWFERAIAIRINAVNDPPIINMTKDWMYYNDTDAESTGNYTISVDQGGFVNLTINITDSDSMDFDFEITDSDLTGITSTSLPFILDEDLGNINFTPTNDDVGQFVVTLNVSDGDLYDEENVTFMIANANDEAMLEWANNEDIVDNAASITGLDTRATQDEKFNLWVRASDIDLDIGETDTLTFAATSTDVTITDEGKMADNVTGNFSFTPDNDNALIGWVHVNVTVKDATGAEVDDWAMINISVANMNDAPEITMVAGAAPPVSGVKDMGTIKTTDEPATTSIMASDIDEDTLTCTASAEKGTATATANATMANKWDITYTPPTTEGEDKVNLTINDGNGGTDLVTLTWTVESGEEPNRAPTLSVTTSKDIKLKVGEKLIIKGTYSDPDEDDIYILANVNDTTGTEYGYINIELLAGASGGLITAEVGNGSWEISIDTEQAAEFQAGKGSIKFKAVDYNPILPKPDDGKESDVTTVTIEMTKDKKEDDDDDEDKGMFGMGAMVDYAIILIIIIIIIIIILLVVMKKKKPEEEEAPPPEEAMVPPAEVACMQCGAMIPPGSEACPACGAPAPPPSEAPPAEEEAMAPPMEMACPACGAMIPEGFPTCPACGAAAPAPPEAPPEEMPPEEMPPEAPPEEMPPEGMPPEAPPEAPPEGMPPEAPPEEMPPEQPPAEAPPEQAPPPAGMATCPTCGAQLAVGTTPCPGCGTALNW